LANVLGQQPATSLDLDEQEKSENPKSSNLPDIDISLT
jgi:hypothetical protein